MRAFLVTLIMIASVLGAVRSVHAQVPPPTVVTLDVKPGSEVNAINVKSHGVIPVAILCTLDPTDPTVRLFDPSMIDQSTLTFGPAGEAPAFPCALEDVNADTCPALVCHFHTHGAGIRCDDTEVGLNGATTDGTLISGSDVITTVGCQGKGPKR